MKRNPSQHNRHQTLRGYAEQREDERVERERRAASVARSMDSMAVDEIAPSTDALRDAQDYVDGRRTLDELAEGVVRRHTRRPDEGAEDAQ